MWMSLLDEDTAVISEFGMGSHADLTRITDQAARHMTELGYEVFRVPAHLGLDPVEIRLRNAVEKGYVTCNEQKVTSCAFSETIEKAVEMTDWKSKYPRSGQGRGIGSRSEPQAVDQRPGVRGFPIQLQDVSEC